MTDGAYLDLLYNEGELLSLAEDNDDIDDTSADNDSDSSENLFLTHLALSRRFVLSVSPALLF
jgi:hypothetical protein